MYMFTAIASAVTIAITVISDAILSAAPIHVDQIFKYISLTLTEYGRYNLLLYSIRLFTFFLSFYVINHINIFTNYYF